jgi:hypothetical protein
VARNTAPATLLNGPRSGEPRNTQGTRIELVDPSITSPPLESIASEPALWTFLRSELLPSATYISLKSPGPASRNRRQQLGLEAALGWLGAEGSESVSGNPDLRHDTDAT